MKVTAKIMPVIIGALALVTIKKGLDQKLHGHRATEDHMNEQCTHHL